MAVSDKFATPGVWRQKAPRKALPLRGSRWKYPFASEGSDWLVLMKGRAVSLRINDVGGSTLRSQCELGMAVARSETEWSPAATYQHQLHVG